VSFRLRCGVRMGFCTSFIPARAAPARPRPAAAHTGNRRSTVHRHF
jgi:hypothetical protein